MTAFEELQRALPKGITVMRKIHDGGQRKVFEADDSGSKVVIKLMPEETRNRAEREVAIGRSFDHPNLPRIIDDEVREIEYEGSTHVWFREALIEGEPFDPAAGRLEPCEALRLCTDLVAAVTYLWEKHSVVHRDIKPRNIMCPPDGGYVLIDVGIGRHQGEDSITSGALGPGTSGHIAPEQLVPNKGRDLDSRTDLFLIGIVVYQGLTGFRPFRPEQSDYEAKLLTGDWPMPPGLSPALSLLLSRLLARYPHQRPSLSAASEMVATAKDELECS